MKYKLIDFRPGETQEVETGTCELCFGTSVMCNDVFVFEDKYGRHHMVDSCQWSASGGHINSINIPNVIDFAAWLDDQEVEDLIMRWGTLWNLVEKYCKTLNEEREEHEPTLNKDLTSAGKLKAGIPLSNEEMLDIVLHIDESFDEYVSKENKGVYILYFKPKSYKDKLDNCMWYSLSYQCNVQGQDFVFGGQPKKVSQKEIVGENKIVVEREPRLPW